VRLVLVVVVLGFGAGLFVYTQGGKAGEAEPRAPTNPGELSARGRQPQESASTVPVPATDEPALASVVAVADQRDQPNEGLTHAAVGGRVEVQPPVGYVASKEEALRLVKKKVIERFGNEDLVLGYWAWQGKGENYWSVTVYMTNSDNSRAGMDLYVVSSDGRRVHHIPHH
jgi:hypothetical protein